MVHRSLFKVFLGLIVAISLLGVIGLFFMGAVRSSGGPLIFGGHPMMSYPTQGEEGTVPPVYYGGWHTGARSMLCGSGLLLLLGLPLLLLVLGGIFFRHRIAGSVSCGPMMHKPHSGRGHPWPWEEELSEAEMKRMKHWHRRHGVKEPWNENWDEGSEQTPEKPQDEPR